MIRPIDKIKIASGVGLAILQKQLTILKTMKILPLIAVSAFALTSGATISSAAPFGHGNNGRQGGSFSGRGHADPSHGRGNARPSHGHGHVGPSHGRGFRNAPIRKIRTVEVSRHRQMRMVHDRIRRPYRQYVTVVTYVDYYSNGTSRTWTRIL